MGETEPLFRAEAVEYQASHRGPGEPLRLTAGGWTSWAYWALLALVIVGAAAALVVQVDGERLLFVLIPALGRWWRRFIG